MLLLQLIVEHLVLSLLLDYMLLKVMQFALNHQIFVVETLSLVVQILRPGFSSVDLVFKVLEHKTRIQTHSAH